MIYIYKLCPNVFHVIFTYLNRTEIIILYKNISKNNNRNNDFFFREIENYFVEKKIIPNLFYWNNIDIQKNLSIQIANTFGKDKCTIVDERFQKELEVILEPMTIRWPRIYPHGNYFELENENYQT